MTLFELIESHSLKDAVIHFSFFGLNLVYLVDDFLKEFPSARYSDSIVRYQKKGDFHHIYIKEVK